MIGRNWTILPRQARLLLVRAASGPEECEMRILRSAKGNHKIWVAGSVAMALAALRAGDLEDVRGFLHPKASGWVRSYPSWSLSLTPSPAIRVKS